MYNNSIVQIKNLLSKWSGCISTGGTVDDLGCSICPTGQIVSDSASIASPKTQEFLALIVAVGFLFGAKRRRRPFMPRKRPPKSTRPRSDEATTRRTAIRLDVAFEAANRRCTCPANQPHVPDCVYVPKLQPPAPVEAWPKYSQHWHG